MKALTLEQYVKQEIPERGNKVVLTDKDYFIGFSFEYQDGKEYMIKINHFEEFDYSLKGQGGYLFAVDKDGNRKAPSVFFIESIKEE